MTYDNDSTHPPARATGIAPGALESPACTMAPPRRIVVHPLLLLGSPGYALRAGRWRAPRRGLALRRRKGER
jgi:hypothetical protein